MGMGRTLTNDIVEYGILAIVIVVVLIVLTKFKDISGSTTETNSTIDLFITGLSEPANWIAIIIIAIIGFFIIQFMKKKGR